MKTLSKCLMMATLMATFPMMSISCNQASGKKDIDNESKFIVNNVKDNEAVSPDKDKKKTEKYLIQRVSNIYKDVCNQYNAAQDSPNLYDKLSKMNFDSLYCSEEWNDLVSKVNKYDEEHNPDGIGFFDFDYWIMGQDFQDMSFHDVKVISMNDNEATVSLTLVNFSDIKLKLSMVYERGDWYIDNFENLSMEFELKNSMKEYLKS